MQGLGVSRWHEHVGCTGVDDGSSGCEICADPIDTAITHWDLPVTFIGEGLGVADVSLEFCLVDASECDLSIFCAISVPL